MFAAHTVMMGAMAPAAQGAVTVVTSTANYNTGSTSRTPSVTFAGYTPVLNDVAVLFGACPSTSVTFNGLPSGWDRLAGTSPNFWVTNNNSRLSGGLYHVIDATDVANGTTTYSATNYASATSFMLGMGVVLRGVNLSDVLDSWDSDAITVSSTSHNIAGAGLTTIDNANGLWLAPMIKTSTAAYPSPPAGWTALVSNTAASTNIRAYALLCRTALVSPGDMPLSDVTYTIAAGGNYATFSTVISAA